MSNEHKCIDVTGCNIFVIVVQTAIWDCLIFYKAFLLCIAFHVYIFLIVDLINS